jgi:hypothetical protein
MPRLSYPLKKYEKAVEQIAHENGLVLKTVNKGGSIVRFELFEPNNDIPTLFWVIHHEHKKKKHVVSKEDYKKAAIRLGCSLGEFIQKIEEL